jgi:hypothetical protein
VRWTPRWSQTTLSQWYSDTMKTESRHSVNADGTWKLQLTFRGSRPDDQRLAHALRTRAERDGKKYADVIREALTRHLDCA